LLAPFREVKLEFVALLAEAIDYLDAHQTEFMHQLGGARTSARESSIATLINPLYNERELNRVFDRGKGTTRQMDAKDEELKSEYYPTVNSALAERFEGDND